MLAARKSEMGWDGMEWNSKFDRYMLYSLRRGSFIVCMFVCLFVCLYVCMYVHVLNKQASKAVFFRYGDSKQSIYILL